METRAFSIDNIYTEQELQAGALALKDKIQKYKTRGIAVLFVLAAIFTGSGIAAIKSIINGQLNSLTTTIAISSIGISTIVAVVLLTWLNSKIAILDKKRTSLEREIQGSEVINLQAIMQKSDKIQEYIMRVFRQRSYITPYEYHRLIEYHDRERHDQRAHEAHLYLQKILTKAKNS